MNVRYENSNRRKCRLPMCERRVYLVGDTICVYHKNRLKWLTKHELIIEDIENE